MNATSLLLIDQCRLFREGLRRILADSPFVIKYEAGEIDEAFATVADGVPPQIVLIDIRDTELLTRKMARIRAVWPRARVVVLTEEIRVNRLSIALTAGVDGYLAKDMSADALKHSLRLVLLGEKVFPTDLANLLINGGFISQKDSRITMAMDGLSARERQVLSCLLSGYSNKVIANKLDIAEGTVKVHIKAVLKKLNVRNRTQAAIWALSNGVAAYS